MPPFSYNFSKSLIGLNSSNRYSIEDSSKYLFDYTAYLREMEVRFQHISDSTNSVHHFYCKQGLNSLSLEWQFW